MSCESYDWKAYALGELDRPARREAEAHAATCADCREELATLRLRSTLCRPCARKRSPAASPSSPTRSLSRAGGSDFILEPQFRRGLRGRRGDSGACVRAPSLSDAQIQAQIQARVDVAVNKAVAEQTEMVTPLQPTISFPKCSQNQTDVVRQ